MLLLDQQFAEMSDPNVRCAHLWMIAEKSETLRAAGLFSDAASCLEQFLNRWDQSNIPQSLLNPIAWEHVERTINFRDAGQLQRVLEIAEEFSSRFAANKGSDIQFELACVLNEKARALLRLSRLSAAIEISDEVIRPFSGMPEKRVLQEITFALQVQAGAKICRSKLFSRNGLW